MGSDQDKSLKYLKREAQWSDSVAVESMGFVECLQQQLGRQAAGRKVREAVDVYVLHESDTAYRAHFDAEKGCLSMDNGVYFDENA